MRGKLKIIKPEIVQKWNYVQCVFSKVINPYSHLHKK